MRALEVLRTRADWEVHLVATPAALHTLSYECGIAPDTLSEMAGVVHNCGDIGASIASGSFRTEGMIILPCSMKTLAGIHSGYSENLLLRAADVTIKQRRKLVLAVRETPLSSIHLRNMQELSTMGCVIMPPMMSFYSRPATLDEMILQFVGKALSEFSIEVPGVLSWEGG